MITNQKLLNFIVIIALVLLSRNFISKSKNTILGKLLILMLVIVIGLKESPITAIIVGFILLMTNNSVKEGHTCLTVKCHRNKQRKKKAEQQRRADEEAAKKKQLELERQLQIQSQKDYVSKDENDFIADEYKPGNYEVENAKCINTACVDKDGKCSKNFQKIPCSGANETCKSANRSAGCVPKFMIPDIKSDDYYEPSFGDYDSPYPCGENESNHFIDLYDKCDGLKKVKEEWASFNSNRCAKYCCMNKDCKLWQWSIDSGCMVSNDSKYNIEKNCSSDSKDETLIGGYKMFKIADLANVNPSEYIINNNSKSSDITKFKEGFKNSEPFFFGKTDEGVKDPILCSKAKCNICDPVDNIYYKKGMKSVNEFIKNNCKPTVL